jgi:hypothetical protein
MSLSTAVQDLRTSVADLNGVVAELVMIVHEDRPSGSDLALVDHLAEVVSELQAGVVGASSTLSALTDPRQLPDRLPMIDEQLGASADHYWRDLRGYEAVAELRRSAQGRGGEWRTWPGSVQASVQRCDAPLAAVTAALRAAWREVGELLVLCLPVSPSATTASQPSAQAVRLVPKRT